MDVPVLSAESRLDAGGCQALRELLHGFVDASGPGVVVDLGRVGFMSSEAFGHLIRAGMLLSQDQRRIALARADRRVQRMLVTMGLESVLPHFRTLAEAQAYVAQ